MSDIVKYEDVESKVIQLRGQQVIVDRDVAELYGVETKEINQAVKNNPDKFPDGYIFELSSDEVSALRSNFLTANVSPKTRVLPKAFTEKGLYMLATILKSPSATQATISIVETFVRLREFGRVIDQLPDIKDERQKQALMNRTGTLFGSILDSVGTISTETTVELNLAVVKVKHSIKREKRKDNNGT